MSSYYMSKLRHIKNKFIEVRDYIEMVRFIFAFIGFCIMLYYGIKIYQKLTRVEHYVTAIVQSVVKDVEHFHF